jgi:hypothetical protein
VIAAGGRLGGYGGNEPLKRALLVAEGVTVVGSRVRVKNGVSDARVKLAPKPPSGQRPRTAGAARRKPRR